MLKEISISEIPERKEFGKELTQDGAFAEKTLLDFCNSGMKIAEIEGWPSGEPKDSKTTGRYQGLMMHKIKKHKKDNIKCISRGRRIFLQKTLVYKIEGDGND